MVKRYKKTPRVVSVSAKGIKSFIYEITVEGSFDIRHIFISYVNDKYSVVELLYDASLNQLTGKVELQPIIIRTKESFYKKEDAIEYQRKYIRENALTYKRIR